MRSDLSAGSFHRCRRRLAAAAGEENQERGPPYSRSTCSRFATVARISPSWRSRMPCLERSAFWWPGDSNAARLDNRKAAHQAFAHFFDSLDDRLRLRSPGAAMKPHKHDACRGACSSKDQLAEISILGDNDTRCVQGLCNHALVARTLRGFGDRNYIMPGGAKRADDRPRATLVGEELHDQGLLAFGESESRTISSCATLAAP